MTDVLDLLADRILIGDGCWEWDGGHMSGYAVAARAVGGTRLAHRIVYEFMVGPIPEGLELDHLCRNHGCVRPSHLEPVTHAENCRRGRAGAHLAERTHCRRGHPYEEENTRIYRGRRYCRACQKITDEDRRR